MSSELNPQLLTCVPRFLFTDLHCEALREDDFRRRAEGTHTSSPVAVGPEDNKSEDAYRAHLASVKKKAGPRGIDFSLPGSLVDEGLDNDRPILVLTFDGLDHLPQLDKEGAEVVATAMNGQLGSVFSIIESMGGDVLSCNGRQLFATWPTDGEHGDNVMVAAACTSPLEKNHLPCGRSPVGSLPI